MHSAQCCDLKIWKTFQVGFSVLPSPSIPSRPVGPPRRHLCCRLGRALRLHGETAVPDGLLAPRSAVQRFSPEGRQKRPQNRPRFLYGRFLPKGRPGEFAALQQRHQVWRWRFLQIEWFRDGYFSPMLLQHQFCDNSADGIRWFFRLNPFRWSKNPEKIPSLPWFACILPYSPGARPMATGTDIQTLTRGSKEEVGTAILGASKMRSKKTGEWLSRRDLKLFEVNGIDGWKWLQFGFMMDDSWVHNCKNMETSFKYVFVAPFQIKDRPPQAWKMATKNYYRDSFRLCTLPLCTQKQGLGRELAAVPYGNLLHVSGVLTHQVCRGCMSHDLLITLYFLHFQTDKYFENRHAKC